MNKGDYLSELHRHLMDMPVAERDSAMRFYMEYFDDAGAENEQTVMLQLGTPRQLADQLRSEMGATRRAATSSEEGGTAPGKRGWRWWTWGLVILASPVLAGLAAAGFGLLIGLLAVVFSLLLVMIIVVFLPMLVSASLVICGVFSLFTGSLLMWREFATALYFVGTGLVALGGGALLFQPSVRVLQGGFRQVFKCSGWIVRKLRNPWKRKGAV